MLASTAEKSGDITIIRVCYLFGYSKKFGHFKEPLTSNKLNAHFCVGETYVRWGTAKYL